MDIKPGDVVHTSSLKVNAYGDGVKAQFSFGTARGSEFVLLFLGTREKGKDTIEAVERLKILGFVPEPAVAAGTEDVTQWPGFVASRFPYTYAYDLIRTHLQNPVSQEPISRSMCARFTRKLWPNEDEHKSMMEVLAKMYLARQRAIDQAEENVRAVLTHNGLFNDKVLETIKKIHEEMGE